MRSISNISGIFINMAVLESAEMAGINFSLVLNLYSLTPFLTAILFYAAFKERLAKTHIVGMFFIFACIAITSESNTSKPSDDSGKSYISVMIPVCLALCVTVFYTSTNFLTRFFV